MYIFWLHKVIASHCCNTIVRRCDDRARGNLINYIQSVRSSSSPAAASTRDNYFECFLISQPCPAVSRPRLPQHNTTLSCTPCLTFCQHSQLHTTFDRSNGVPHRSRAAKLSDPTESPGFGCCSYANMS